jgi:HSP20 family protein
MGVAEEGGNVTVERQHFWHRRLPCGQFGPLIASGSPFAPMAQLSLRMERMMHSFDRPLHGCESNLATGTSETPPWSPDVDVREGAESILISVDLPGVSREDVCIETNAEGIAISGERRGDCVPGSDHETQRRYHIMERNRGGFRRVIPLPRGANVEAAKAGMHAGVLEITIPLLQIRPHQRIAVEVY